MSIKKSLQHKQQIKNGGGRLKYRDEMKKCWNYEGDDNKDVYYKNRKEILLRCRDGDRRNVDEGDGRGWGDVRFMDLVRVCQNIKQNQITNSKIQSESQPNIIIKLSPPYPINNHPSSTKIPYSTSSLQCTDQTIEQLLHNNHHQTSTPINHTYSHNICERSKSSKSFRLDLPQILEKPYLENQDDQDQDQRKSQMGQRDGVIKLCLTERLVHSSLNSYHQQISKSYHKPNKSHKSSSPFTKHPKHSKTLVQSSPLFEQHPQTPLTYKNKTIVKQILSKSNTNLSNYNYLSSNNLNLNQKQKQNQNQSILKLKQECLSTADFFREGSEIGRGEGRGESGEELVVSDFDGGDRRVVKGWKQQGFRQIYHQLINQINNNKTTITSNSIHKTLIARNNPKQKSKLNIDVRKILYPSKTPISTSHNPALSTVNTNSNININITIKHQRSHSQKQKQRIINNSISNYPIKKTKQVIKLSDKGDEKKCDMKGRKLEDWYKWNRENMGNVKNVKNVGNVGKGCWGNNKDGGSVMGSVGQRGVKSSLSRYQYQKA